MGTEDVGNILYYLTNFKKDLICERVFWLIRQLIAACSAWIAICSRMRGTRGSALTACPRRVPESLGLSTSSSRASWRAAPRSGSRDAAAISSALHFSRIVLHISSTEFQISFHRNILYIQAGQTRGLRLLVLIRSHVHECFAAVLQHEVYAVWTIPWCTDRCFYYFVHPVYSRGEAK